MPIMEPTEEIASERWCHAFATTTWLPTFLPTWTVSWYITSFAAMETRAIYRAIMSGVGRSSPRAKRIMSDMPSCISLMPTPRSIRLTARVARVSNLPCPYLCPSSLSAEDMCTKTITTKSLIRSDNE